MVIYDSTNIIRQIHYRTYNSSGKLILHQALKYQNNTLSYDYKYEYNYDTAGNQILATISFFDNNSWVPYSRFTFDYDNNNNLIRKTLELQDINGLKLSNKYELTYDTAGNLLVFSHIKYINNQWVNDFICYQTFDNSNNILTEMDLKWINNQWVNQSLDSLFYNSSGLCTKHLVYGYTNNNPYYNVSYHDSYNSSGLITESLWKKRQNGVIMDYRKYLYSYNSIGELDTVLTKSFNNTTWNDVWRTTLFYDNNGLKDSVINEYYLNNSWLSDYDYKNIYTHDNYGNILSIKSKKVNTNLGSWINDGKFDYTYDTLNRTITGKYHLWANNSWIPYKTYLSLIPENYYRTYYGFRFKCIYNTGSTTTNIGNYQPLELNIFPNPAHSLIRISFHDNQNHSGLLRIYNSQGQIVKQTYKSNVSSLNIQFLPKGIYFLEIKTKEGSQILKFIKE